jgi:hypothetical protein
LDDDQIDLVGDSLDVRIEMVAGVLEIARVKRIQADCVIPLQHIAGRFYFHHHDLAPLPPMPVHRPVANTFCFPTEVTHHSAQEPRNIDRIEKCRVARATVADLMSDYYHATIERPLNMIPIDDDDPELPVAKKRKGKRKSEEATPVLVSTYARNSTDKEQADAYKK